MEWLGVIIAQVGDKRAKGLLKRDVWNMLAFFKRKYGVIGKFNLVHVEIFRMLFIQVY